MISLQWNIKHQLVRGKFPSFDSRGHARQERQSSCTLNHCPLDQNSANHANQKKPGNSSVYRNAVTVRKWALFLVMGAWRKPSYITTGKVGTKLLRSWGAEVQVEVIIITRVFLLWWLISIRNLIFFSYVSSLVLFLYALPELCLISWNLNSAKWWFIQLWYYLDSVFPRCLLIASALQPNSLAKIRWANWVLNTEFIFLPKTPGWRLLKFYRTQHRCM